MVRNIVVLGGNSHPQLTETICNHLGVPPANILLGKFAVGETRVEIKESVAQAMEAQPAAHHQQEMDVRDPVLDFGFLVDFGAGGAGGGGENDPVAAGHSEDFQISDADIGLLLDENFSLDHFSFQDPLTGQTLATDDIT